MLPAPMLARPESTLPAGDYAFEVKWDGFRAIVSTEDGFRVRSRRGWNMAPLIPELARDDVRGVFDGELVSFREGVPHFPLVTARMLHRRREVPVAFAVFDVLSLDGERTINLPYAQRRELLETLDVGGNFWFVPPAFDDGPALFAATCEQGLEGVVAKRRDSPYRPGDRGWIKVKNRGYWGSMMSGNWRSLDEAARRFNPGRRPLTCVCLRRMLSE
jgi:bifunctional non-homologous end joining protein LigD